ncbi:hypothetical protein GCM10018793_17850 [Streptomyces sulfonofaciens]|uniref:HTH gntR-type domain-containing protein n=1 Tax=Streptomyces sulfonofaciens TaxID=68272 RepID=A0A919G0C3_9ACTN|nr:GntR family transcriptional regulator [Streptomyces sulfonofaciens]GHH75169.1 hypothetical protein GCM10018793_17850 [Streptomyces sulfonofaciens]
MSTRFDQAEPPVDLVDRIRQAIAHGELLPGRRLVENDLAAMFDVSRGAVRSALVVLDSDGLVTRSPHRGARVRPISLTEAVEITELRAVVEGLCAARAAQRATPDERAQLRRLDRRMRLAAAAGDTAGYSSLSQAVHQAIREIAAQATAVDVLDRLRYRSVRYQFGVARLPGRPEQGAREHGAVVRAVVAGRAEEAEHEMRAHLESVVAALYDLGAQDVVHGTPQSAARDGVPGGSERAVPAHPS